MVALKRFLRIVKRILCQVSNLTVSLRNDVQSRTQPIHLRQQGAAIALGLKQRTDVRLRSGHTLAYRLKINHASPDTVNERRKASLL
jgi:hypothetical protein